MNRKETIYEKFYDYEFCDEEGRDDGDWCYYKNKNMDLFQTGPATTEELLFQRGNELKKAGLLIENDYCWIESTLGAYNSGVIKDIELDKATYIEAEKRL